MHEMVDAPTIERNVDMPTITLKTPTLGQIEEKLLIGLTKMFVSRETRFRSNVSVIRTRDSFEQSWSIRMPQPIGSQNKKGGSLAASFFKTEIVRCDLFGR
jgi:hypothetical protein